MPLSRIGINMWRGLLIKSVVIQKRYCSLTNKIDPTIGVF